MPEPLEEPERGEEMGHERVGCLPQTRRWQAIVDQIAAAKTPESTAQLAAGVLKNVQQRYERIAKDRGVQAAFGFLVALATAQTAQGRGGVADAPVSLESDPSAFQLAQSLSAWVDQHQDSLEYAQLAKSAATDAIATWLAEEGAQSELFSPSDKWRRATSAAGFCEIARFFFAHLTRRYLSYFLDRAASSQVFAIGAREALQDQLEVHVDEVWRHAFETSRIMQSYAAGWYNNHAREAHPSDAAVKAFLVRAFAKVGEELRREAAA